MITIPQEDSSIHIKLPLECARAYVTYILFHELGHFYHKHPLSKDKIIGRKNEKIADAYATRSFEAIIGGVILFLLEDIEMSSRASYKGYTFADTQSLYYKLSPYDIHPSHHERLNFFKNELKKHLRWHPQNYAKYMSFKKLIKQASIQSYGYTYNLSFDM